MAEKSKQSADGPRKGVNTRITDSLRFMLMDSADAANRSLGAEIEYRLAASFKAQDHDDLRQIIREEVRAALKDQAADEAEGRALFAALNPFRPHDVA